jgi:transposase-like protein
MGKRSYKCYPIRFRERAVERLKLGESATRLAKELGVERTTLYVWKRKLEGRRRVGASGQERDSRDLRIEELEAKVARLEGVVGRQWFELDFFDSALRRIEETGRQNGVFGGRASTPRSAAGCKRKAD